MRELRVQVSYFDKNNLIRSHSYNVCLCHGHSNWTFRRETRQDHVLCLHLTARQMNTLVHRRLNLFCQLGSKAHIIVVATY